MGIKLATRKIKDIVHTYWIDEKTYIFKNSFDAIFGAIVLIVIPCISLVTLVFIATPDWANYTFPILSMCFAGIYDAYGRYEAGAAKNVKLAIRSVVDIFVALMTALFTGTSGRFIWVSPVVLLCLCGVALIKEVFMRVKTAIEISPWASVAIEIAEREDNSVF